MSVFRKILLAFVVHRYRFVKKINKGSRHLKMLEYSRKAINFYEGYPQVWSRLPVITKNEVINQWSSFVTGHKAMFKFFYSFGYTGGTTGKPMKLVQSKLRFLRELGAMYGYWWSLGWRGECRAVIRNASLPDKQVKMHKFKGVIVFDGFKRENEYLEFIWSEIERLNVKWIHAYPSSAYSLFKYARDYKIDFAIRGVFMGSEGIHDYQKVLFNSLKLNWGTWYGHSEKLIFATKCPVSDVFHLDDYYGYTEVLGLGGEVEVGCQGSLVGSNSHNKGFSLIRYDTNDRAIYLGDRCPSCGEKSRAIRDIIGRWDNNLIALNNGSTISTTALNSHDPYFSEIHEGLQYRQTEPGSLKIYIIKSKDWNEVIFQEYQLFLEGVMSGKCEFQVEFIDKLIFGENGKFNLLLKY